MIIPGPWHVDKITLGASSPFETRSTENKRQTRRHSERSKERNTNSCQLDKAKRKTISRARLCAQPHLYSARRSGMSRDHENGFSHT